MSKYTPWFKAQQKPERKGIYQRDLYGREKPWFSCWSGTHWSPSSPTKEGALANRAKVSGYQCEAHGICWRGLREARQS